ncbi:MAG: TonB family protein [Steroidobacteraceae bacterium]|nr:TonB family protein [Steroidobacteraceae bacterium]
MSNSAPQRQPLPASETRDPGVLVDVLVLSEDLLLFDAIRGAIGERNPVWRARSAEESVDLLLTGRCGVLLVDMAAVSTMPATLITEIVAQFPDVVVVVAGRLEDEALLAGLISSGCVYRFMHKPLTAKRAGMFLNAAVRRHVELREAHSTQPLLPLATMIPGRFDPSKWLFVTGGLAIFVALLWLFLGGGFNQLADPPAPAPAHRAIEPATQPLADPVLSRARAAFVAGRFEAPSGRNALDLYAAVLLSRPDQAEARAGLDRTIEHLVSVARQAEADGNRTEARRLLARLQSADAASPAVTGLAEFLATPPQPEPAQATKSTPAPTTAAVTQPVTTGHPGLASPPAPRRSSDSGAAVASVPPVTSRPAAIRFQAPPRVSQPTTTTMRPVVTPDPLTPTVANADEIRAAALRARRAPRPAPASSMRTASRLPIAGYVRTPTPEPPAPNKPVPRTDPAVSAMLAMPSDELGRVSSTNPVYPAAALRDGVEGWVELSFTITETGTVRDIEVVDATPRGVFESSAMEALASWRYKPRIANGQPVAHRSTATLRFDVDR